MYYLQKICVILAEKEDKSGFALLERVLALDGIRLEYREGCPKEGAEECPGVRGILYITDSNVAAKRLLQAGKAVLVYLHEGNAGCQFGEVKYAFEKPEELNAQYLERVYRRYIGVPWDILETARCILRETVEEDVPAFYEIYKEPSITEYMEDLFADPDEEMAYTKDYREKVYDFYGFGIWTVIEKESGRIIGRAGCTYREGFEDPELGFLIGVPWQRKGYAKEVCRAILLYAQEYLGFERMQAFVQEGNLASIQLCKTLGMDEAPMSVEEQGMMPGHIRMMTHIGL